MLEEQLQARGREVLRLLLQDHQDLRAARERRREQVTGPDGIARTRAGAGHSRPLSSVFGQVTVSRVAYQSPGAPNVHSAGAELNLAAGQTGEALRQIVPARHDRVPDQDRNDPHVAGQGGLDFQPDKVIWIVKPPTAPLLGGGQPLRADDHKHLAGRHRTADRLGEVHARLDRI